MNFEQALDMNSTVNNDMMEDDLDGGGPNNSQKQIQKVLEIKNEEFQRIGKAEVHALSARFADLQTLNLSMNKILRIDASITADCPNLKELILSDNLLKQIDVAMFANGGGD